MRPFVGGSGGLCIASWGNATLYARVLCTTEKRRNIFDTTLICCLNAISSCLLLFAADTPDSYDEGVKLH